MVHLYPTVVLEQLFIFVGLIGFKILTEEENVKYIRSTFSKFVSKDVVDELLKNPDNLNLGGSKRDITIFFSDIRGFTTMSGPEGFKVRRQMDIGIGLNSGPAVVGNMGSSHRMDYTCMGDTINLGSRLEGTNRNPYHYLRIHL
ncbi:adenylate/guanylate cyclase catalytic domain protein [Leptospira santarosai str. HAI134]|nr:adenylate/guanylate cyclase catalytic domain protein [Leptospira santarosai str. HAI134]